MERRTFLRAIGLGVLAVPLTAEAQQAGRIWRIGVLTPGVVQGGGARIPEFRQRLRELDYIEGQNVTLEYRAADGKAERYPGLAAELVRLNVDVIVAVGNPAVEAAQKATTSIPIVMNQTSDPVATGFVGSLARPGRNITGLTIQSPDLAGKGLQLLKEAVPTLARVAALRDPRYLGGRQLWSEVEAAATVLGLKLQLVEVRDPGELDNALAAAAKSGAEGVVNILGNIAFDHRARIAELAIKRHLPIVGVLPDFAEAGWLMSYGPSRADQYRRAVDFVDRILKGAKPADLPVEQPTKFYLVINLKTAKALGLTIPQSLQLRADQVIQ